MNAMMKPVLLLLLLLMCMDPSTGLQSKVVRSVLRKIPRVIRDFSHHEQSHYRTKDTMLQSSTRSITSSSSTDRMTAAYHQILSNPTVHPTNPTVTTTTSRTSRSRATTTPAATRVVTTPPRGGATTTVAATPNKPLSLQKILLASTATVSLLYMIYLNRHLPIFDKRVLQDTVLSCLHSVSGNPFGVVYYILGLAVWELCGLSTIPVETAAGMAFGAPVALGASLVGKLSGASVAFGLGRHSSVAQDYIRPKLQRQPAFALMEQSVEGKSFQTALLLKYSCVPEFVKNFGASLLRPISFGTFFAATLLHGGPFTVLWSFLGHDAALRLVHANLAPNAALQRGLVAAAVVGLVVSPVSMAWWIHDMRTTNSSSSNGAASNAISEKQTKNRRGTARATTTRTLAPNNKSKVKQ